MAIVNNITFDSLCLDIIHLINLYIPPYILRQYVFLSKKLYNAINNEFFQKKYCDHYITTNLKLIPKGESGNRLLLRELFRIQDGFYLGFMGYETYIKRNYRRYLPKRVRIGYSVLNGAIAGGWLNIVSDLENYGVITDVAHDDAFEYAVKNKHFEVIGLIYKLSRDYLLPKMMEDAIKSGNLDTFRYLFENGHTRHEGYYSIIALTVESGKLEILKYLMNCEHWDMYKKNGNYKSIITVAAKSGQLEILKYLLSQTKQNTHLLKGIGKMTNINWRIKEYVVSYLEKRK